MSEYEVLCVTRVDFNNLQLCILCHGNFYYPTPEYACPPLREVHLVFGRVNLMGRCMCFSLFLFKQFFLFFSDITSCICQILQHAFLDLDNDISLSL